MKISKLFNMASRFVTDVVRDPVAIFGSATTCFIAGAAVEQTYEVFTSDHKIAAFLGATMSCCLSISCAKSVKDNVIENRRPIVEFRHRMQDAEPK